MVINETYRTKTLGETYCMTMSDVDDLIAALDTRAATLSASLRDVQAVVKQWNIAVVSGESAMHKIALLTRLSSHTKEEK